MILNKIENEYFNWLYDLVCNKDNGNDIYHNPKYLKLFTYLYNTEFIYLLEFDDNRAVDGIDFRYRFGYEFGYSNDEISNSLSSKPCNVLEMMVALAFRVEEQIMYDEEYGDRTAQWFWNMIVSLGLGRMDDTNFNERYVSEIINTFLNREYSPNGKGGLFTIDTNVDLRYVDIWTQFMWYLNTIN